jgi:hypothetical protein
MKRRYFWWGLCGAAAVLSFFAVVSVVQIAFSYDGKCGGLMPFLAGPRPCSFWQYVSGGILLSISILLGTYWPLVVALLVVPTSVGFLLDIRVHKRAAQREP